MFAFTPYNTQLWEEHHKVNSYELRIEVIPFIPSLQLDLNEYMDSSRAGEWVPYVQASRDEQEQNLEAVLLSGSLHYRVLRTVPPGTEVLVWYDRELAAALAIPELQPFHIKGKLGDNNSLYW